VRVGIGLLTLVPGGMGGSEVYARSLCRALAEVGTEEYLAFVSPLAPDAGGGLPTRVVASYRTGNSPVRRAAALAASWARPTAARSMGLDRLDVVHFPFTVEVPRTRCRRIVTVHDVQHLVMPEFFSRATRAYRALAYARSTRRADRVIAISDHVARTLVERLLLPAERVVVVHSGVDHTRYAPPPQGSVREPFLLYPANPWPHKNHARLLEAFERVRRAQPDLRLLLTGAGHPPVTVPGVEVRGYVTGDELVRLYRTASALVFPSLYEGFGQPLLEAMACGCPVAASDVAAIPEVCGGAAVLFDPTSPEAIAEGVERVLGDAPTWAARGLERAAAFSWEETARRTEDVYRSAAA
jgi:glycosyltransferase involved in cell wall biosynthesis